MKGGRLLGFLRDRVRVAFVAGIVLFLWCVAQFHHRDTGFSSLISIGDVLTPTKVTALKGVPHHVYESSPGYDGAYYVQLALYPTLDNPELTKAIDNLPYRAKRILFCWAAWALGLGQPAWVVQVHALLNVGCWLVLAFLLLRWFPLNGWENFLRWAGVMFSHGLCMSVRHSLVDGPSLLLVALAMRWMEEGRRGAGVVTLGLAGLGKETSLLASAALEARDRGLRTRDQRPETRDQSVRAEEGERSLVSRLWSLALQLGLIALPLAVWVTFIRWKFGPAEDPGMGNFTWPFAGYAERLGVAWREVWASDRAAINWAVLATVLALAVQWSFFALRWRPAERWWRVGAAFALMMVFLSTPVWEGYPGAATRVLLPMTLAFNVLVPRGGKWLALVIAGNLTVAASVFEFSPPNEFYRVRGPASASLQVIASNGWHGPERHLEHRWRWAAERAELTLINKSADALSATVRGGVLSVDGLRGVRVMREERLVWGDTVGEGQAVMQFGLTLPPGETVLVFASDRPPRKVSTDPRDLGFQIANLDIVVTAAGVQR